jgi:hypothetical protein
MTADADPPRTNPFSTRFVRPGALPYRFAGQRTADQLIEQLRRDRWRGQIVGPHGSGKSTLLCSLQEPLQQAGHRAFVISLREGQRWLPAGWRRQAIGTGATLIVVDGCEQLARVGRWLLRLECWARGWGLLVTSHRDLGLPTLFATATSVELAERLTRELLGASERGISARVIAESFAAADGDMRETLFALYDRYEAIAGDQPAH